MSPSGIARSGHRVRARQTITVPRCPQDGHVTQRHGLNHRRCPECGRLVAVETEVVGRKVT